jgi:hypothetical protein
VLPGARFLRSKSGRAIHSLSRVNHHLDSATSPGQIKDHHPASISILSDFVLIKLSKKSDKRQFQVQPAGGGKSVIKKEDEMPFKSESASAGTYKITLDASLKPGEYTFLMSRGAISNMRNPVDKIYDFTVTE